MPVPIGTPVEVLRYNGAVVRGSVGDRSGCLDADFWFWVEGEGPDALDIVAYRVLPDVLPNVNSPEYLAAQRDLRVQLCKDTDATDKEEASGKTFLGQGTVYMSAPNPNAPEILDAAAKHMRDRAATYDNPEGERSMAATVAAFNAQTGRDLTEAEGWLLMVNLKIVRDRQRDAAHRDSIEDGTAYFALYGEARLKE